MAVDILWAKCCHEVQGPITNLFPCLKNISPLAPAKLYQDQRTFAEHGHYILHTIFLVSALNKYLTFETWVC